MKRLSTIFLTIIAALLIISCKNTQRIADVDRQKLALYDYFNTNETAACIDVGSGGKIDSVRKAKVLSASRYSVQAIDCEEYNGMWHTHPKGDLVMSRTDYEYATENQLLYMALSLPNGMTAVWYIPDVAQQDSKRYRPDYVFNLNK